MYILLWFDSLVEKIFKGVMVLLFSRNVVSFICNLVFYSGIFFLFDYVFELFFI